MALTVEDVNALGEAAFVATFGHVYEHTPELAAAAWRSRPFADLAALVASFSAAADDLDDEAVLALLRAHPRLGDRGPMAAASIGEQRSAGLIDGDGTVAQIRSGDTRYLQRFGFPFIIAVRGMAPADIADALAARLDRSPAEERAEALRQVHRIARLRLEQAVAP